MYGYYASEGPLSPGSAGYDVWAGVETSSAGDGSAGGEAWLALVTDITDGGVDSAQLRGTLNEITVPNVVVTGPQPLPSQVLTVEAGILALGGAALVAAAAPELAAAAAVYGVATVTVALAAGVLALEGH